MSSSTIRHGSCLCKAIKYEIKGDPFSFFVCHCRNCGKASGSAFSNNCFFKPENVVITHGKETIKAYKDGDTTSGRVLTRSFCSECGTSLFLSREDQNYTMVTAGTIDDDFPWMPRRQVFEECQRPWVEKIKFVEKPPKATL